MGRSKETFGKKNVKDKQAKKRKEKEKRRLERKEAGKSVFEEMIAYIDENGNIVDTPPDMTKKIEINVENIDISIPKMEDRVLTIKIGTVDFFNIDKGFGFIKEKGRNDKFFCHIKNLIDNVREGDRVNFEIRKGIKGMEAYNVKIDK